MSVKIRLSRAGTKKRPYYRIVIADSRAPRDGRFIEKIGTYNPLLPDSSADRLRLDGERAKFWLSKGALPTDRVAKFLDKQGLFKAVKRENAIKGRPRAKAQERLKAAAAAEAAPAAS